MIYQSFYFLLSQIPRKDFTASHKANFLMDFLKLIFLIKRHANGACH